MLAATTSAMLLAGAASFPASADTPANWEQPPAVSGLDFLIVLVLIPLGVAAVLTLLTVLPSMSKSRAYEPGQAWRGQTEWFGGPTKGVAAADGASPEEIESGSRESGGSSARW